MSEIAEVMIKDYRKNIEVKDVKLYRYRCWDTLVVKIIDNNKKCFLEHKIKKINNKILKNNKHNQ